ncbi:MULTISPECIES: hypothetical protein [Actinomycetes]
MRTTWVTVAWVTVAWVAAALVAVGCSKDLDPSELEVTDARHGADPGGDLGELEVTLGGETHRVAPSEVLCSGPPGEVHHLIATTGDDSSRVEVAGEDFAQVRLEGAERPQETTSPDGIELGEAQVEFATAAVGDAEVEGTLHCSEWED